MRRIREDPRHEVERPGLEGWLCLDLLGWNQGKPRNPLLNCRAIAQYMPDRDALKAAQELKVGLQNLACSSLVTQSFHFEVTDSADGPLEPTCYVLPFARKRILLHQHVFTMGRLPPGHNDRFGIRIDCLA